MFPPFNYWYSKIRSSWVNIRNVSTDSVACSCSCLDAPSCFSQTLGEGNKNSSMGIIIIVLWPVHVVYFLYTSYYSNYVWHLVIERSYIYIWKIAFYSIDKWSLLSSIHETEGKWYVSWGVHQNDEFMGCLMILELVGGWALPLWKIWKSVGIMKFPTEWKNNHVPNHQTVYIYCIISLNHPIHQPFEKKKTCSKSPNSIGVF